jgi:hypothetical protein
LLNDLFGTDFPCSDTYGNVNETKGGHRTIELAMLKHSTQLYVGVWMSRASDHNILVLDVEGLSKEAVDQTEVSQHLG